MVFFCFRGYRTPFKWGGLTPLDGKRKGVEPEGSVGAEVCRRPLRTCCFGVVLRSTVKALKEKHMSLGVSMAFALVMFHDAVFFWYCSRVFLGVHVFIGFLRFCFFLL